MEILPIGKSLEGGLYSSIQNVQIVDAAVSSVIFTTEEGFNGDNDYSFALNLKWKNPLTGVKRLILQFGASEPTQVVMWKNQRNLSTNTNEDAAQTHYYIAELTAGVVNTQLEGVVYFTVHREGFARYLKAETMADDSTGIAHNALRATYRQARWGNIVDNVTDLRVVVEDASNAIGIGSEFRLWRIPT